MGCGNSTVKEDKAKQKKSTKKTSSTKVIQSYLKKSNINTEISPGSKDEFTLIYFAIEVNSSTSLQIVGKSMIKETYKEDKKTLYSYLKSNLYEDDYFRKLTREKLEFLVYTFIFKSGKKKILNFFDIEDYNFYMENNDHDHIYAIWLLDFMDLDLDPEGVFPTIKEFPDINDVVIECENIGPVYTQIDPDLNDDGYVDDIDDVEAKHVEINDELTSKILQDLKKECEENKIASIALRKNNFKTIDFLFEFIKILENTSNTITSFEYSEILNVKDHLINLLEPVSRMNNLRHLNLSMVFIYDKYTIYLFNAIKTKRLLTLDLSSNFITYLGAGVTSKWLRGNRTLKELSLQQNTTNEFRKEGFDHIAESLINHPKIESLDFSLMIMTGIGVSAARLLNACASIKILRIKGVRLNYEDYKNLIPALCKSKTLKELNMGENDPKNERHTDLLGKLVSQNTSIEVLFLDSIGLELENSRPFFMGLKKNTTIKELSLNHHPEITVKKYLNNLKECPTIKILSIINRIGPRRSKEDIQLIETYMKENPDVTIKY